jgi:flagellar biosynthesis protein FlhG
MHLRQHKVLRAYLERQLTRFSTVVNMAKSADQAEVIFEKFKRVVCQFLPVELFYDGFLPHMADIKAASTGCHAARDALPQAGTAAKIGAILKFLLARPS